MIRSVSLTARSVRAPLAVSGGRGYRSHVAELHVCVSADGFRVVEADLSAATADEIRATVAAARQCGAWRLWAYGGDLESYGFRADGGYTRLHATECPPGEELPIETDPARVALLVAGAYLGVWGHKEIGEDFAERVAAQPNLTHVVLDDVGICRIDRDARVIDGPGVAPGARTLERYLRLVLAACAVLGPGEATIESWGDSPEVLAAYQTLGFAIAERLDGWSLDL